MWQHNLKLTFRNFKKNKISFLINIIGLSTGLACVLLIYLWVNDEWNMDKFHVNSDRIYKVMENLHLPQGTSTWENTPILLAQTLAKERPEVESAISICSEEEMPVGVIAFGEKEVFAKGLFAEENFFEFFSFHLIYGDKKQVLENKNNIVLSESLAQKLFGSSENAMNKMVTRDSGQVKIKFTVSGIFKNLPVNSIADFDFVSPIKLLLDGDEDAGKWNGDYAQTFILLNEDTDLPQFNQGIAAFMEPYGRNKNTFELFAQKYSEKYLNGKYENGKIAGGRITYVKIFSIIAIFILLIGCINFINLSTAQASLKKKEIGVKKTIGATRGHLIFQLLSESTIMALMALTVSIALVFLLLPAFNEITGKELHLVLSLKNLIVLFSLVVFTGIISGSYSAFYISGFNPGSILKGTLNQVASENLVRKSLVVFQFSLSIIFIVGVLTVQKQMDFIQSENIGFNRSNILIFQRNNFDKNPEEFITELKNIPDVLAVSSMFGSILDGENTQSGYSWRGDDADRQYLFKSPIISYDVMECLGMELLSGRSFSKTFKEEQNKIIINESARKMMELENPIGKTIEQGSRQVEIIGVVNDFNYGSMHHKIEPLIFRFTPRVGDNIMIKIKAGAENNAIKKIEKAYHDFHPAAFPFQFTFMDEAYQALYTSEKRVAILFRYFSGLAIVISCLGLFGLVLFTIERRKKEISIRKVLGASAAGVVGLLSKDYLKPVLLALFIASPLAWYFMEKWLQNFAYRITLDMWIFVLAGFLTICIAFITISFQSVKAALSNPVNALKTE